MKVLVITQKVDKNDGVLGFFHDWILEMQKKFQKMTVVCLEKGEAYLPGVEIFSLGKERGLKFLRRIRYIFNFYKLIFRERKNYEAVFVHMNQEYVILGWWLWKLLGKRIFLWRNHPKGNFLTRMAVFFSDRIFYTSPFSYTARFKKGMMMPVGVKINEKINYKTYKKGEVLKILCLGRIAPVKNIEIAIEAAKVLKEKGVSFKLDIVGDVLERDKRYGENLKAEVEKMGLLKEVDFYKGVSHEEALKIFSEYDVLINVTDKGSMDKTIFEAGAAGVIVVSSNEALAEIYPKEWRESFKVEKTGGGVAEGILNFINLDKEERGVIREKVRDYVRREESLEVLVERLGEVLSG